MIKHYYTPEACQPAEPNTSWLHSLFFYTVKSLEKLGSKHPFLSDAYFRFFYQNMLRDEISLSGIQPGMNVAHVGCGALPMTAISLARAGARVTAVDLDPEALSHAEKPITRLGLQDKITLYSGCGTKLNFAQYDAVWLSLHVRPVDRILKRAMDMLPDQGKIVMREPRGALRSYYPGAEQLVRSSNFECCAKDQILGKTSLVLTKKDLSTN